MAVLSVNCIDSVHVFVLRYSLVVLVYAHLSIDVLYDYRTEDTLDLELMDTGQKPKEVIKLTNSRDKVCAFAHSIMIVGSLIFSLNLPTFLNLFRSIFASS